MTAVTANPIDWLYAAVIAVPLTIAAVSVAICWREDRHCRCQHCKTWR